jgi:hypothetical protein
VAITSGDQLLAGLLPPYSLFKPSATSEGAGLWHSLWKGAGAPAAGANPPLFSAGSGYAPNNTTLGAIPYTNPVSGNSYLAKCAIAGGTVGTLVIYDRLWACSGFGTVVTTAQAITTPGTIPSRDRSGAALGEGVELWGEVYTAPGATGATWTVSYTDQDGNTGQNATYAHPANAESVGQMFRFNLAAGDTGVRAVASFTASVSSGTAGDIGITLVRRIAEIPLMLANVAQAFDAFSLGLPRIYDGSCLALMVQCSTTNTGLIQGSLALAQG